MTSSYFFEAVQNQYNKNLPFVVFRNPNETVVKCYLQKDAVVYKTTGFTESGFVFVPFDGDAVIMPSEKCDILTIINVDLNADIESKNSTVLLSNEDDKLSHIQLVKKGIDAIQTDAFQKLVLSRKEAVSIESLNAIKIFQKLVSAYDNAFVYCWFHPEIGLWLGATPETLVSIDGKRLTTMSLAGTQKYSGTLDVVWTQKELREQQLVTDFILNQLKLSNLAIQASNFKPETVKAGNVVHLRTSISAIVNDADFNFKQLLYHLHPTPAVCGLPKQAAKQFILDNEHYDREFYTGFLGELNIKKSVLRNTNSRNVENNAYTSVKTVSNIFVNLRCMQIKDQTAWLYIGGGITKDSNPEAEWEETVQKALVMKKVLKT